jgi:signal recognition particle GTPase
MKRREERAHVRVTIRCLQWVYSIASWKRGALSEDDVGTALRVIRIALLRRMYPLPVAAISSKRCRKRRQQSVAKSVTPSQQVVKIVHDRLVHVLQGDGDGALKIDNRCADPDGRPAGLR